MCNNSQDHGMLLTPGNIHATILRNIRAMALVSGLWCQGDKRSCLSDDGPWGKETGTSLQSSSKWLNRTQNGSFVKLLQHR